MFQNTNWELIVLLKLDDRFITVGFIELLSFLHQRLLFNNIYYFKSVLAHLLASIQIKNSIGLVLASLTED